MRQRVNEQPKPCVTCGQIMFRKRYGSQLEGMGEFTKRKFCSLSCANTRGVLTRHGYSWRARKHLKHSCEACGWPRKPSLQAHHVDQDITNNEPENIQTLCKTCHDFWHSTAKRLGRVIAGRMPSLAPAQGLPIGWSASTRSATATRRSSSKR